jgi:nucleotide-binding universal stress UspA family protein
MKAKPGKRTGDVVLELDRRDEPLIAAAESGPFQIKRILVPIDFSDCAKKALRYALPFAQQQGATLVLLYVVPTPPYGFGEYTSVNYAPLEIEMSAGGKKALADLAKAEIGNGARTEIAVRTGSAGVQINDFARSLPADMIIISTHGYSGLKHVLMGSVAEYVVRHAPCPVLVVREHEHEFLRS